MKDMLTIASGFQYSVNIAFDLYNDEKLENYIKTEKIDYSNMISDTGYNVGILIEKFMNKGIKKTVKILSSLFLD